MLKFMKISSHFSREVLKFMKISSQKHWVYDTSSKKVIKRLGFLIHGQLEACILRGSFSEIELPLSYNAHSRGRADGINWLRDQPFEQGMTIYIYRDIHYK